MGRKKGERVKKNITREYKRKRLGWEEEGENIIKKKKIKGEARKRKR